MPDPRLRRWLERTDDLYVFPVIATRVMQVTRDPNSDLRDLERVVGTDPVLTGRMVELANSALYARGARVESLGRALQRLGFRRTRDAAVGLALSGLGRDVGALGERLWAHAVRSGDAAHALVPHLGADAGGAFLSALLHTLGLQLMALLDEGRTAALLDAQAAGHPDPAVLEREAFEVTSPELGAACLERWYFSDALVAAVRCWRHPLGNVVDDGLRRRVAVIQLCDALARAAEATDQLEGLVTVVASEPACRVLGLTRGTLEEVAKGLVVAHPARRAA